MVLLTYANSESSWESVFLSHQQVTTRLQDTDMTVKHRQTQITKEIHKRNTALERSGRKLLEGLNSSYGTNMRVKMKEKYQNC